MADLFRIRADFGNRSFNMVSVAREIYNVDFASGTLRKGITYGYGLEDKKALQERVLRAFGQTELTVEFLEAAHATHDAIRSVRQQISSFFHGCARRATTADLVQEALARAIHTAYSHSGTPPPAAIHISKLPGAVPTISISHNTLRIRYAKFDKL